GVVAAMDAAGGCRAVIRVRVAPRASLSASLAARQCRSARPRAASFGTGLQPSTRSGTMPSRGCAASRLGFGDSTWWDRSCRALSVITFRTVGFIFFAGASPPPLFTLYSLGSHLHRALRHLLR